MLGIGIPEQEDSHASKTGVLMAEPLCHNFLSSTYVSRDGCVGIANDCVPTTFATNGIICRLAPWEGVWIFKVGFWSLFPPRGPAFVDMPVRTHLLTFGGAGPARQQRGAVWVGVRRSRDSVPAEYGAAERSRGACGAQNAIYCANRAPKTARLLGRRTIVIGAVACVELRRHRGEWRVRRALCHGRGYDRGSD